jgi:phosphoglycerol transferase
MTTLLPAGLRAVGRYVAALLLCLLVLGIVFDLRSQARQSPWAYGGDTMFYHLIAKSVAEGGWFLDVPRLGTPSGLNLRDVPTSDNNLHVLMLRLLALGTSNYASVLNTFFLLGFPLVFVSALVVLRHFGVGWVASVCASLLYAFAPFHFTRGEHHLFLSAYWQVPLASMAALWVSRGELWPPPAGVSPWRSRKLQMSVLVGLVLAATGYYYAFFACFFLILAGIAAAVRLRAWRGLWPGVALAVVISAGLAAHLWPSLAYFREAGTAAPVQREVNDADRFALRIAQLVLPVSGHRLPALARLKADYNRRPMVNENDHASLGLVGALGFLGLVWWFFFRKPSAEGLSEPGPRGLLHHLSVLNLGGVLFGTFGGFGSLLAFSGVPQVRAYNRISVYLLFFALAAVAVWLDRILRRCAVSRFRQGLAYATLAVASVLALGDQISPGSLPEYKRTRALFASDAAFVREVEATVSPGAQIFQLPFMPFPESAPVGRMQDYDLLRGYLHSSHLRWSYGTIKGREGNAWLRQTARQPVDKLIETLAWAGFSGVYLDRGGFDDNGHDIEHALRSALRKAPIVSPDERLAFYDLSSYRAELEQRTPLAERGPQREAALRPILTVWRGGFHDEEGGSKNALRWAGRRAQLELVNRTARAHTVAVDMMVFGNDGTEVTIRTPLLPQPMSVKTSSVGRRIHETLVLPPGSHTLDFSSNASLQTPADDFRDLAFFVQNFALTSPTEQ